MDPLLPTDLCRPAVAGTAPSLRRLAARAVELRWLLLANLFLLSPVLLHDLPSGGGLDPVALWVLLLSLGWLTTVQLATRRPALALLALSPLALVVTADLFLIAYFDARLGTGYLSVAFDNATSTDEFLSTYRGPLLSVAVPGLLLFLLSLWRARAVTLAHRRRWALAPLACVLLLYGAAIARQVRHGMDARRAVLDVLARDTSSPFGFIAQGLVTLDLYRAHATAMARRTGFTFGATRHDPPAGPELHVLVLGETARPDHWSVNGYARETSPRLSARRELLSFRDAVTQSPFTNRAVPLILTRATIDDFARAARERSIVSAFEEVGFRTCWLAAQEVNHWGGFIFHFAAEADVRRHFERRHDDVLLAPFGEVIDSLGPDDRAFVVLHLQGSHFVYENRYPAAFERFPVAGAPTRRDALVNAYDNSILFTDHVLGELIARLEARPDLVSTLTFVSDHGENLLDDERALLGHGQATEFDLRVPLFFWPSPAFARARPDAIAWARAHLDARVSTANVFHSLADVGGLRGAAFDRSRSLFSPSFRERPRLFARHDEAARDFDAFLARPRGAGP